MGLQGRFAVSPRVKRGMLMHNDMRAVKEAARCSRFLTDHVHLLLLA